MDKELSGVHWLKAISNCGEDGMGHDEHPHMICSIEVLFKRGEADIQEAENHAS